MVYVEVKFFAAAMFKACKLKNVIHLNDAI